jgi:hypothetical protein
MNSRHSYDSVTTQSEEQENMVFFLVLQTILKRVTQFFKRDVIQMFQSQSCDGLAMTHVRQMFPFMLSKPF